MNNSIKFNGFLSGIKQFISYLYGFIITVYISRILGSAEFGRYNFGLSVISYFSIIASFGIGTYAVREGAYLREDKSRFNKFCNDMFTISIVTTFISYLGIFFLINSKYFISYKNIILILSIPILFQSFGVDWVSEIFEDYLYTTIRYIVLHVIALILIINFVKDKNDILIFLLISIFPNVIANIVNMFYLRKKFVNPKITRVNINKYFLSLFVLFCNAITITVYVESDKTILTLLKGTTITGIYSIAVSIYTIIKTTINSIISVTLPRLSAMQDDEFKVERELLQNKIFHLLLEILLPCMVGIFCFAKQIIMVAAGDEYLLSVNSLRILSFAVFFGCLSFFYVYAIMLPRKLENKIFISTVISAFTNVALNYYLIPVFSLDGAALTTLISEIIVLLFSIYNSRKFKPINLKIKEILPVILGTITVLLICIFSILMFENSIIAMFIAILISIVSYGFILYRTNDLIFSQVVSIIIKKVRRK